MVENLLKIYRDFGPPKLLQNLPKILPKDRNRLENVKNSGIFSTFLKIDSICQKLTVFLTFLTQNIQKCLKKQQMAQIRPKIPKIIPEFLVFLTVDRFFGVSTNVKNVPEVGIILQKYTKVRKYYRNAQP